MYTGTRPGVSPAIRAGKGWRGRRELAPRCSATQLGASRWRISTETCVIHEACTTTTTRLRQVCELWSFLCVAISWLIQAGSLRELLGVDVSGGCARCFVALAAALHHSAGPVGKVEMQQNGAPRGQKTAARAREVEEQATHDGLRAQTAPPPGVRPGSLAEPGPQRSDRSLRCSSGQTPLLGVPSLADAPAEAIDGRTLRYLLKANLARKKYEEEEEEEKKYQEKAAEPKRRAQALLDHAASLPKRKRKKRRKKKLPRGCARRRQWQRPLSGALIVDSGRGMCRAGFPSSRCVPFGCRQAQMLGIMAGMTRRTRTPFVSGSHLFAVLLGSTVDTCYVSLQRLLWVELFVFSAMLGSTLRNVWFNSGSRFMRQTTEAGFAGAVLFFSLFRPMMRCIMAGMDQEYS